ncbi:hypothetical protein ACC724_38645, partial [Rhizobium ruizarguesonis]
LRRGDINIIRARQLVRIGRPQEAETVLQHFDDAFADNFDDPEQIRHKVHFDNLTPLYPNERFKMELDIPTTKDLSPRVIDLVAPLGK